MTNIFTKDDQITEEMLLNHDYGLRFRSHETSRSKAGTCPSALLIAERGNLVSLPFGKAHRKVGR